MCPALNKFDISTDNISTYSVYSKDEEVRKTCSSGGIGHEIGKLTLNKGYEICGVVYDTDKNMAEHVICNNEIDLEKIKGSKYIQSYSVKAFKEILKNLKDKKYVVFGTPCQIYAIDSYARLIKKRDNLLLIDFFCHGTPSYLMWEKYIQYIQRIKGIDHFEEVRFRDKKYGWHSFTISIKYNENVYYFDKKRDKDLFYEFFLGNYCLNEACYTCKFRTNKSNADIRIGDLWAKKYANDKKGVSGVIVYTNIGKEIMDELKEICYVNTESVDVVLEGQMKGKTNIPKIRNNVLKDLTSKKSLMNIYYKKIVPFKIKRRIKHILKIH